ncbi:unnamed protein product [Urochloa decumbens]|uniref:AAA+ ATPase domain-containing protein n=1 Tax=Urochloa decumbens TaxID=240449 RepID=A0ABC9FP96_9POAL
MDDDDDPTTCALPGAMGALLAKFDSIMASANSLPSDFKNKVESGMHRTKMIHKLFVDLSELEDPPLMAKLWMREVQELYHDMEDKFAFHAMDDVGNNTIEMARKIVDFFEARVQDAWERQKIYGFRGSLAHQPRRFVSCGPRRGIPTRHEDLIEDHGPMEDIVRHIAIERDEELRVACILGVAGVGKTTLARRIYQNVRGRFECRAFVRVTSYPDMRRLLTSLFIQIQRQQPHENWDANDLIRNIASHLENKRYFILVDDIHTASVWDIVSRAFPVGRCSSQIITTTQVEDVAMACCSYLSEYIFHMRPLNEKHSRQLFFGRAFGCEDDCPIDQLREVSYEIIRQCGGLPLSIVNIASLFECEPVMTMEHWKHIKNSLCSSLNKDYISSGVEKVLYLVYNNLPPHLKPLLLYLNMYPADYTINKDDLVKQWVAEGFVCLVEGQDREEVAEGYFDELISRGMLQPEGTNCHGQVSSCTVHHAIRNLISWKSMEENFITIMDYFQTSFGFPDKVRRLSVQFGGARGASMPVGIRMSQVRSLAFFGFIKCLPSIVKYKLLRVLVLHIWADQDKTTFDLTTISELYLLKFLKIQCNVTVWLPEKMGNLEFLETLDVHARVKDVPSDIVGLKRLLHLLLPSGTALPDGIGEMISLRTLGYFDLTSNLENNALNLGMLTNLQELHLTCPTAPSGRQLYNIDYVGSLLSKLSNVKSLTLVPSGSSQERTLVVASSGMSNNNGLNEEAASRPPLIESLQLLPQSCIFSSFPKWLRPLNKLYIIKIAVRELSLSDICLLKELPALTALSLHVQTTPSTSIVIGQEGFQVLRFFTFRCALVCFIIQKGAMPRVERIKIRFCVNQEGLSSCANAGLDNLTSLKEISAKVWRSGDGYLDTRAAEKAEFDFMATMKKIVNTPIINVRCVEAIAPTTVFAESPSPSQCTSGDKIPREDSGTGDRVSSAVHIIDIVLGKIRLTMKQKGLSIHIKGALRFIKDELEMIKHTVNKYDELQLQELAYDIEDVIDGLLIPEPSGSIHLTSAVHHFQYPVRIDYIKERIVRLEKQPHKGVHTGSESSGTGRSPGYSTEEAYLVGMEKRKEELLDLIVPLSTNQPQLRVVSIVGCIGVGKTALARAIYNDSCASSHFDCIAWVVASECKYVGELLIKIAEILQPEVGVTKHADLHCILAHKRYLVIIDDVQKAKVCKDIVAAFPRNCMCSRIIVTTSVYSVATACSFGRDVYTMQRLNQEESESLFWRMVYGKESTPCWYGTVDASQRIFSKCDGLPLALISVAKHLNLGNGLDKDHLEDVGQNLGIYLAGKTLAFEELNRALEHCYDSLPDDRHKECLLYLSIFPKGYLIKRKITLRRWIAEGLVGAQYASKIFDELIDRNIVMPVFTGKCSKDVERCRMHSIMLEFIIQKSSSKNIVTLIQQHGPLCTPHSTVGSVRRLSIQSSTEKSFHEVEDESTALRSLSIFNSNPFNLQNCMMLRLLDLEGCTSLGRGFAEGLCSLLLLRYLSLRKTDINMLPTQIYKLQCLETLDIRETQVKRLTMGVIMLPKLANLFGKFQLPDIPKVTKELSDFFKRKSVLHTLSGFVANSRHSPEYVMLLARKLKKVEVWCNDSPGSHVPNNSSSSSQRKRTFLGKIKRLLELSRGSMCHQLYQATGKFGQPA